jgi:GT2 family glycosyltransferase
MTKAVAGMAVMPHRLDSALRTLRESAAEFEKVFVGYNGSEGEDRARRELSSFPNVQGVFPGDNLGDALKLKGLDYAYDSGAEFYFTLDDDIGYPPGTAGR